MPEHFKLVLKSKQEIAPKLYLFTFKKPQDFSYKAGQFMNLEIPSLKDKGPSVSTRSMSLASAPYEEDLVFAMWLTDSEFKQALNNLNPDDSISALGPLGHLTVDEGNPNDLVLIAGGIGITPLRSIVLDQLSKNTKKNIYLFCSCPNKEKSAFSNEFMDIKNPNFHFIPTLTQTEDPTWKGERGRINLSMLKKHLSSFDSKTFYLVGRPSMVKDILTFLKEFSVDPKNFKLEVFPGLEKIL